MTTYDIVAIKKHERNSFVERITNDLSFALPQLKIKDYFKVKQKIIAESDYVIVSRDMKGHITGLIASKWYTSKNLKFLHIMTIFIAEKYQGTFLFKHLWNAQLKEIVSDGEFPVAFSLKTYNPISFSLLRQVAGKSKAGFYPCFKGGNSKKQKQNVLEIVETIEPDSMFDLNTGVVKDGAQAVPSDFYPQIPKTFRSDIMSHFENKLTANDRLLCCLFCEEAATQQNILQIFGVAAKAS